MKVIDDGNLLDTSQRRLVRRITVERLSSYGFQDRVRTVRIVAGCPASEFEDEDSTIIRLCIQASYLAKPNINFIISHEIQHRIDELNPHFGYDKNKKERLRLCYDHRFPHFSEILAHLWDIFINGRLNRQGLYQVDTGATVGIKGKFFSRDLEVNRDAAINFLDCRGIKNATAIYHMVFNAKEGELSYDQLVNLVLDNLS